MSDILFRLAGDNAQFKAMLENSQNLITKFNGALNLMNAGLSIGVATSFFKTIVDQGGKLQDLSDRLEVSTDNLQAFGLAVSLAGGSGEQANMVWDRARKSIDGLAMGAPAAVEQFKALGLTAESFVGLDLAGSLEAIAQGYQKNADTAGAYEAITDILGAKSAPALLAAIKQLGEEGFGGLNKALDESGTKIEKDTIRQLDQLGDSSTVALGKLKSAGASVIGVFLSIGEIIGQAAGNLVNKWEGLDIVPLKTEEAAKKAVNALKTITPEMVKLTAEGKKSVQLELEQADAARAKLDSHSRYMELRDQEVNILNALEQQGITAGVREALSISLAHTRKKLKEEEKVMGELEEKHAKTMEEFGKKELDDSMKLLTFNQQMAKLKEQEVGWAAVLADESISAETRRYAEIEQAKVRDKMRDLSTNKMREENELAKLLLIPEEQRTASEKLRLQVLQGVVSQKELDEEKTRLIAGLSAGTLTPAEKERLAVLMDQASVLNEQLQTAKAITVEVKRTGKSVDQQSDDSLIGVEKKLKSQIDQITRDNFGKGGIGSSSKPAELYLLESELFNLQKEMRERQDVRDYAGRYGEQKARQQFGDTLTEKALRDWTNRDERSLTAIEDIQARLAALLPKK